MTIDRCFACDKIIQKEPRQAFTRDGQHVIVGVNCARQASNFGTHGYQPRLGGPRIFTTMLPLCAHKEHGGNDDN